MLVPTVYARPTATGPAAAATRQRADRDEEVATSRPEDWSICLKDAHPAYLDWDEFMANRRQLVDNVGRYDAGRPGAPRKGNGLLQGIARCGRCAPPHVLALAGTERGLSGLCVRCRQKRRRATDVPRGASARDRC